MASDKLDEIAADLEDLSVDIEELHDDPATDVDPDQLAEVERAMGDAKDAIDDIEDDGEDDENDNLPLP
jgi:hypothetical protein